MEYNRLSLIIIFIASMADSGATSRNYIRTVQYNDSSGNETNARISVAYYDGLGRERILVNEALGGDGSPVAVRTDYDTRGNVGVKWLPVPGGDDMCSPQSFKTAVNAFYGADEIPYTKYTYEDNGLNRVTSVEGPGLLWSSHPTGNAWFKNSDSGKLACLQFSMSASHDSSPSISGVYPIGSLRVTSTTDEDGKERLVFQDRLKRIILERMVATDGNFSDTYFVYDARGDMRFAITPEGSALLPSSGTIPTSLLNNYAQAYTYDVQHRCISSRAPGCGETQFVYDKLGRVIFESTETQRNISTWTLTKYDSQFRKAVRGVVKLPGKTRAMLQNEYGDTLIVEDPDYNTNDYEVLMGYPKTSGPSGFTPYIAWMYDNYDFLVGVHANEKAGFTQTGNDYTQSGMCTGILMKTGLNSTVYVKALGYDYKGNLRRSYFGDLYLQEFRLYDEYEYDFTGNVIQHKETYDRIHEAYIINEHHVATTVNTYDLHGRLLTSVLTVDDNDPVTVQNLTYDSLGRLSGDASGAGISYGYDIRSNLREISSPVFSQKTWFGSSPVSGSSVSYIYPNASRLSWGVETPYTHIETYHYDGFGHFHDMATDNSMLYEKMEANLNADVTGIVRRYRGDAVQDVVMQMDGCKIDEVRDVSTPYWTEEVPSFSDGCHVLEYDRDGRLIRDETRDIISVSYHPFGNLPDRMKAGDGSYVASKYFADGTLFERSMLTRKIEIVVKVNSKGDTVRRERDVSIVSTRKYAGNFEWHDYTCMYNTGGGHYDLASAEYYRYICDRLGSTVAVTDGVGNLVQTTGYYPSGTPYKLPSDAGTDVDAVTEKLHIGNKWIGHKGFDLYDNTARMHDPLLARFHSVDPLFGNYPGSSPWTHCLANPLSFVDPDGRRVWEFDQSGYFKVISETDFPNEEKFIFHLYNDQEPINYNALCEEDCFSLPLGSIISHHLIIDGAKDKDMEFFMIRGDDNGQKLFKEASIIVGKYAGIEFGLIQTGYESENSLNFFSTSHLQSEDYSMARLYNDLLKGHEQLRTIMHNHPCGSMESESDKDFFNSVIKNRKERGLMIPKFLIFLVPQKQIYTYDANKR